MTVRAHDAAAQKDGDRNTVLFEQRHQFVIAPVTIVEGDDQRLGRQTVRRAVDSRGQIFGKGNDIVAASQSPEMEVRQIRGQRVINDNCHGCALEQFTHQEGQARVAQQSKNR